MVASLARKGSVSEELFPFLMTALETCLINLLCIVLADIGFLGSNELLFPLWLPFLLLAIVCWIVRYPTQRLVRAFPMLKPDAERPSSPPLLALCLLLVGLELLFVVCSSQYTPVSVNGASFLQTTYLAIGTVDIWRLIIVLLVTAFLCWRGVQIACGIVDSERIQRLLRIGLVMVVVFVVPRGYQELFHQRYLPHNDVAFFFLVTLFVGISLFAYPLTQRAYLFHFHANAIRESFRRQEFLFLSLLAIFCLLALAILWWIIALYNHWLVLQIDVPPAVPKITSATGKSPPFIPPVGKGSGLAQFLAVSSWSKILLLILLIGVLVSFLVYLIRRLLKYSTQEKDETHESLWSWSLFWQQLQAIAAVFLGRLMPTPTSKQVEQQQEAQIENELPAHTIRQLYAIFLRQAARVGYARTRSETPNEYRQRLDIHLPFAEPYLGEITEAYVASRYGEYACDETEMARLREIWSQLQQQWQENTSKRV